MYCSCNEKDDKFCKKCYSKCYYELNKERILAYQKERYKKNKIQKSKIIFIRKPIILSFS